jgi:uncharacterized protein YeeX (DUF496 family)
MKKIQQLIKGLVGVNRREMQTLLVKNEILYYLPEGVNPKNISQIKVNLVAIKTKYYKRSDGYVIDISEYTKSHPEVEQGIISVFVDEK